LFSKWSQEAVMGAQKRILLADDDAEFRFSIRTALQMAGYRVSEAEDGADALDKLLEAQRSPDPFDLLVTDIEMPIISGLDLIDEVTVRHIPVSVCLITGNSHDPDEWREQTRNAAPVCLEKPFTIAELLEMITEVMTRSPRDAA